VLHSETTRAPYWPKLSKRRCRCRLRSLPKIGVEFLEFLLRNVFCGFWIHIIIHHISLSKFSQVTGVTQEKAWRLTKNTLPSSWRLYARCNCTPCGCGKLKIGHPSTNPHTNPTNSSARIYYSETLESTRQSSYSSFITHCFSSRCNGWPWHMQRSLSFLQLLSDSSFAFDVYVCTAVGRCA
jgi:hypothetical protein